MDNSLTSSYLPSMVHIAVSSGTNSCCVSTSICDHRTMLWSLALVVWSNLTSSLMFYLHNSGREWEAKWQVQGESTDWFLSIVGERDYANSLHICCVIIATINQEFCLRSKNSQWWGRLTGDGQVRHETVIQSTSLSCVFLPCLYGVVSSGSTPLWINC